MNDDEEIDSVDEIESNYGSLITDLKEEADNIYILLKSMAFLSKGFKERVKNARLEIIENFEKEDSESSENDDEKNDKNDENDEN